MYVNLFRSCATGLALAYLLLAINTVAAQTSPATDGQSAVAVGQQPSAHSGSGGFAGRDDPSCGQGCLEDLDGDLDIDLDDLALLLANYGLTSGASPADGDLDGDEDVDLADLASLLAVYGTICDPDPFEQLFIDPATTIMPYWQAKPLPPALVDLPLQPVATDADRDAVALMMAGEFQPSIYFPPVSIGVPPPWDVNPFGNNTWDLCRHDLRWTEPLVAVWLTDGDDDSLALMQAIVEDWWIHNSEYPGASLYAWNDAAVARRLQRLVWFWELYRTSAYVDESFARLLFTMIHAHANHCADDANYFPYSNHAMMMNTSLIEVPTLYPESCQAEEWRLIVTERMENYPIDNFSPLGFHLEQTPSYHCYVVQRLAAIMIFVRDTGQLPIPNLDDATLHAASLMPYLVRPGGTLMNIGDCTNIRMGNYFSTWAQWWDPGVLVPAESTLPNPRDDDSQFVLDFDAGYAVFTAFPMLPDNPDPDTHVVFKCNAFDYTHRHKDALSFILHGMGHDWITDSGGPYNYQYYCPERIYITSMPAHSLVLIDESDQELGPTALLDFGRNETADFVSASHTLQTAQHIRTLTYQPPYTLNITDELTSTDAQAHTYTQVFHTLPTHTVNIMSDTRVHIVDSGGKTCVIEQSGVAGQWQVIGGQTTPYWQGWQTTGFEVIEPAPAIYFSVSEPMQSCEFITTISLHETDPG